MTLLKTSSQICSLISREASYEHYTVKNRKFLYLTTPLAVVSSCTPCGMAGADVLKEYLYQQLADLLSHCVSSLTSTGHAAAVHDYC
jgi:hypothetical protein